MTMKCLVPMRAATFADDKAAEVASSCSRDRSRLMTRPKTKTKLIPFDAARYLDSDEAIAEYMSVVLSREGLYKALAPGAKPRFDTVMKVVRALGVEFNAQPV
jgi:DNA-binding phage protein